MNKKYAIFDLDGTLIDSMRWWKGLAEEFLRSRGVTEIPDGLTDQIQTMTVLESSARLEFQGQRNRWLGK